MTALYPLGEAGARGSLDVGDGQRIAWEEAGPEDGKPAVVLHGGPGQGSSPSMRRAFDPARYRVILFDRRGSGRSTPHASAPAANTALSTTQHLIADMERLREHPGIERWLLAGASWGAPLTLAYALSHPERVSEIVLSSVTTFRSTESRWLYEGVARFLAGIPSLLIHGRLDMSCPFETA